MRLEDLALIGNGQCAALVDRRAAIVWCCLPRFDSEPVFGSLLDPDGGEFTVESADGVAGVQDYIENTNILETRFEGRDAAFRVLDFAPRFVQHQRAFHPAQIVRIIEPLRGTPSIRVRCSPRLGWSKRQPDATHGSNHIEYHGFASSLRLTTDLPLATINGRPIILTGQRHLVLSWGAPVEEPLLPMSRRFFDETQSYWRRWVKECNLPPLFQQPVIRSALALKLHCYEDTGAIVASVTTSLPESSGSGRTWDYRYCWLRDAYYVLRAFRRLGHFEEREKFLEYLLNIVGTEPTLDLAPLYHIDGRRVEGEVTKPNWAGFNGEQPVRVGNAAALQKQNDVYGELLLALAPIFLDDRFTPERTPSAMQLIERLARKAISVAGTPDAGIWELRADMRPQTFSSLMCWVAADRMAHLAQVHEPAKEQFFREAAAKIHEEILAQGWSEELGSLVANYGGKDLDAALLQAVTLRLFSKKDPRAGQTIDAIRNALSSDGLLLRYKANDGLGETSSAFVICTFWLVEALAYVGRTEEAKQTLERALKLMTPLGLLSEDYDPVTGLLCGNFPQAYSHVGLIHAAFDASPSWSEYL